MRRRENTFALKVVKTSKIFTSLLIVFAQILTGMSLQVVVAPSASAACATGFPTVGWQAIRTTAGAELTDPNNDFTPYPSGGTADISSVTGSPMDWFSSGDGCDFFFRLRLKGDPRAGTGLDNNFYVVAIGRGTTPLVWVGINGDGTNKTSYVYAYNPSTSSYLSNLAVNSNDGTDKIKVQAVTIGATTEYYLQWRIANSILPEGVFTSPVGLFAGTSQSNVVTTINADCVDSLITSGSCTPKYDGTLAVDLTKNTDSAIRPNITSVTPSKGTTAGGTSVSIAGTNLANTSQVYFGGKAATITSSTNTAINVSVSTPASGSTGPVDVFIVNPGGTSNTLVNAYTYITAPVVSTIAASGVTGTSAQLNADINPGADLLTAASFCYGPTSNLTGCTSVPLTSDELTSIGSGTSNVRITKPLSGLDTGSTYYFRVSATNSIGITTGSTLSFTPANATLSITTGSLASGTYGVAYSLSLTATGGSGTYSAWALTSGSLPTGLTLNTTTGVISGTPTATASATPLTFRVTDSVNATASKNFTLTIAAGPPVATTSDPTSIGATSVTLNGSVTANGATTSILFCLATSGVTNASGALTCISNPTASTTSTTSSATVTSAVTGLTSGTIYYYQIYATTVSSGNDYGSVKSFIPASAPSVSTGSASSISSSGATLNGSVTANGSSAAISFCLATSSAQTGSALTTCISNPTSSPAATLSTSTVTATTGGLTNGTTYYFQAYATNSTGTTYGSVLSFTVTATTTTTVTASPTATTLSKIVNLATTVSPNTATGAVVFKDASNNTLCTVASLTSGAGNCDWTPGSAAGYVVTAYFTSDNVNAYTSSTSSTTTVTVNAAVTVSGGSSASTTYGTATTSTAFTSSGGTGTKTWTVALTSGSGAVSGITISSGGVISVAATTTVGTYSMTVTATDIVGATATKTTTITVNPAALTITATTTSSSKVYGASNPTFSFTSSGLKNGEVISSVTNTFTGTGSYNSTTIPSDFGSYTLTPSAVVFAGSASASNYTITYATVAYSITKATQSVLWSPTTTYQTSAQPVTWSSEATGFGAITYAVTTTGAINCAIVSEKLTWTSSATGSCVVTASAAGTSNYDPGSIAKTFTVTSLTIQTITFNSPGNKTYGNTFTVSATASPSGLPVTISTSGGGCTGSGTSTSGSTVTLTASAAGTGNCSITASQAGDSTYAPASDVTHAIDINKASRAITLTAGSTTIAYYATTSITLAAYSGTGSISYSVGTGCSLDAGTLTASTSSGTCAVTATLSTDDNYLEAISNTLTITRTTALLTITATSSAASKNYGAADPTFSFSSGSLKNSESISDVVKTFTGTGSYNSTTPPSNAGTYTITPSGATISGGGATNYTISYVTVSYQILQISQTISFTSPGNKNYGSTFSATATSDSGLAVTITATGDCSGTGLSPVTITPTAVGTNCVLTASQAGNGNYVVATNVVNTISILSGDLANQSELVLSVTPISKSYPYTQVLSLSASGGSIDPGTVTYAIASGGTATGCALSNSSSTATITSTTTGTCLIAATKAGNGAYNPVTSSNVTFTFTQATQTVSFATPSAMTVGDANQSLTYSASSGLTVTLTSNSTAICVISSSSVVAEDEGTCSITASQAGNSNYSAATSVTRTFSISPAISNSSGSAKTDPELIWYDPEYIKFGTALSSRQLNASASVPGSYFYSATIGTVLPVGDHAVSVTFIPSNKSKYNSISARVTVTVLGQVTTPTPTPTPTLTSTPKPTPTATPSATPTPKPIIDPKAKGVVTVGVQTVVASVVNVNSNAVVKSTTTFSTATATPTSTPSATPTASPRPTSTPSATPTASPRPTSTPSATPTASQRPTSTPSATPTASQRPTSTPSATPRPTSTPSATPRPTSTPSATPTTSTTATPQPTATSTPTPTATQGPATTADVKRPVGEGISRVSVSGTNVSVTPQRSFSGITSVVVNVKQDGQTKELVIPITVLPETPKIPVVVPKSLTESVISWKTSPNATSYDVTVKGALVCQTTASSCTAPVAVGPKTPVEITAFGGDNLKSVIAPTYQANKPIPAITVNFATNSSKLSSAQKTELNKIAKYITEEGFMRLVVYGFTDSRGGVDNQALSVARAKSTADYLAKLAPGIDFVVSGFGPSKPVASNKTDAGMAANRRAELSLW
jgi:outer membrane protein OmpA-like peptidoglycan-associated protein